MSKSIFIPCDCNTHGLHFEYLSDKLDGDERAQEWQTLYISDWSRSMEGYPYYSKFNSFKSRIKAAYQILRYGVSKRDGLLVIESPERAKKIVDICSEFILACSSDQYGRYEDE
jgi:hypothetical protein